MGNYKLYNKQQLNFENLFRFFNYFEKTRKELFDYFKVDGNVFSFSNRNMFN